MSIGGRRLLAAAYADGTLRLWDLRRQACLLQEPLKPDSTTADALTPTRLRFAAPSATEARRPGKIIAQFDRPEAASGASLACRRPNYILFSDCEHRFAAQADSCCALGRGWQCVDCPWVCALQEARTATLRYLS